MEVSKSKNGLSVKAYKGDAMTLLAFDLAENKTDNFTGFSIRVTVPGHKPYYLFNRFAYSSVVLKKSGIDPKTTNVNSMEFAPLQKYRWVHTPGVNHNINDPIYGKYTYEVTPRYLIDDVLQPLNPKRTISLQIDVTPYEKGNFKIGFARGFIESQAYTRHFGSQNNTRPNKTDLIFDIKQLAGPSAKDKKKYPLLKDYTYEDLHTWLGWQARARVMELLADTDKDKDITFDVFAFDLNEPTICDTLIKLGAQGRVRIILDNSKDHSGATKFETKFEKAYLKTARDKKSLVRGCFKALAHSKVFIQKAKDKPVKVLTGSTNFSTNGLYINANHVLVYNDPKVAALYEEVFENSLGQDKMNVFSKADNAIQDYGFSTAKLPDMTLRFSPHSKNVASKFFDAINKRILGAKSDVLFAIMKDNSQSAILDAVQQQVKSNKVFTYGITDVIGDKNDIMLYKPDSKKGVRVAGKPGTYILPPPFETECKIPGISVHHKFIVVDFKSDDPVVYCGSSNLAFGPEQRNGDNLIEIRDKDAVTTFAIEAIRLVDHFQWRDRLALTPQKGEQKPIYLHNSKEGHWYKKYYDSKDLMFMERTLLIK